MAPWVLPTFFSELLTGADDEIFEQLLLSGARPPTLCEPSIPREIQELSFPHTVLVPFA